MIYNIEIYFMIFVVYSVLGWLMECTLSVIEKHKIVNRGFLIGPYCPIYGIGVVGVTLLLSRFKDNYVLLFLLSIIVCGSLEYFTSYIMEKIFNARWWDYSNKKFNIKGRICLETLFPFGFLSIAIIKILNPFILDKLYLIPENVLTYICIGILLLFVIDISVSFKIISNFKNMINTQTKDNTEEITKKVKETAEATIAKLSQRKAFLVKRMRIRRYTILKDIRYTRKNYTRKIKNQQITLVGTFKKRVLDIDENIKKSRNDMLDKIKAIKEKRVKIISDIKEGFSKRSRLNKRLISAFPNVTKREYTRKKKDDKKNV